MHFHALSVAAATAILAACSAAPTDDTGETSDEALTVAHVDANNCEIFVDKIMPIADSHSFRQDRVFLKIDTSRLDGAVARVGMVVAAHDPNHKCFSGTGGGPEGFACEDVDKWKVVSANRFAGSNDYFEVDLTIGVFDYVHQLEGAFFVQTTKGTTYWHKAKDHQNFFLDDRGIADVYGALASHGVQAPLFGSTRVDSVPKTADFYPYLNPALCR